MAVTIKTIDPQSPAARLGLRPGDELLCVDRETINDMLDYQFYTDSPHFHLTVRRKGIESVLKVEKEEYAPFGCNFETYLADKKHSCTNSCMFCFIEQLPKGMRDTLYFKDDDERLSFLFGNYITMTNMSDHEIDRIIKMHISPINISVHTTNPELRVRMMKNRFAGEKLKYLHKLVEAGVAVNCQLVLCRGVNDGNELRRTLDDLLALTPQVQSIAAVPAGLTRYREGLAPLTAYDAASSAEVIDILEEYGNRQKAKTGCRTVFPGDEWYLNAGRPLPQAEFYEEYDQLENGVGMWRLFHDTFLDELHQPVQSEPHCAMDVVTGTLAAPLLQEMMDALHRAHPGAKVSVHAIQNNFFGGNVSVAGLVTGTDIVAQCKGKLKSKTLGVPLVMLRAEKDCFLDDLTPADLERELGVKVVLLPVDGGELAAALLAQK